MLETSFFLRTMMHLKHWSPTSWPFNSWEMHLFKWICTWVLEGTKQRTSRKTYATKEMMTNTHTNSMKSCTFNLNRESNSHLSTMFFDVWIWDRWHCDHPPGLSRPLKLRRRFWRMLWTLDRKTSRGRKTLRFFWNTKRQNQRTGVTTRVVEFWWIFYTTGFTG